MVVAGPPSSRPFAGTGEGRRQRRLGRLRQLAEIVAVALLIGAALAMISAGRGGRPVLVFAVMSLISLCFAGAYVAIVRLALDTLLERPHTLLQTALLQIASVAVAAALGGEAAIRLIRLLGGTADRLRVMAIGLAVLTAIRVIELGYDQLRRHVRAVELREERARQHALRAEIAALEARTDPHFLFNSLNTVAGLIEEDPPRAVDVVSRLADYFRHTVRAAREGRVSLADELQAAAAYLEIQGVRFADALSWSIDADSGIEAITVPAFLLQPLVENAVVHGGSGSTGRVRIELTVRNLPGRVEVKVEDDGPGPGGSTHQGSGTALLDLGERLDLLYSGNASIETGSGALGGFLVRVELPVEGVHLAQESVP